MDPHRTTLKRIKNRLSVPKRGEPGSPTSRSPEAITSQEDWDSSGGIIVPVDSKRPGHNRSSSFFDRVLRAVHPGPATTPIAFTSVEDLTSLTPNNGHPSSGPPQFRLVATSELAIDSNEDASADLHLSRSQIEFSETNQACFVGSGIRSTTNDVSEIQSTASPFNSTRDLKRIAHNTLRLSLTLLEKLSESFPVPGLKGGLSSVNMIIDRFDKATQNTKDMDFLLESFTSLGDILSKFQNTKSLLGHAMTTELKAQIAALSETINETRDETAIQKLKDELVELQSEFNDPEYASSAQIRKALENLSNAKIKVESAKKHHRARKVVDADDDAQLIIDQYQKLERSINEILVGSALRAEAEFAEQQAFELLNRLPRAKNARYDYVERPRCLPGTREDVLKEIGGWAFGNSGRQIYWLNGGAGTGKTTVALTLAHAIETANAALGSTELSDQGYLSISFFCSRGDSDRSNIHYIFPTLSYLLAQRNSAFRNELARILKDTPDIAHAPPHQQCNQLLIEPLKLANIKRPIMIILDALDECADPRCPELILSSLASKIQEISSLKIFVSSRSTSSTNDAFAGEELRKLRTVFVLHDVEEDVVRSDIKNYITSRLRAKAQLRRIDVDNWPPEHHVDLLVDKAGGLFIYASTVCEFIEKPGNLPFMLQPIAEAPAKDYTGIDELYRQILSSAIENMDERSVEEVRTVINTIIHLKNPLSSHDLGGLLGYPPLQIQGRLGDLQPVLIVPEDLEEHIHILHASFHDYLTDEKRSLPRIYTSSSSHHKAITIQALKIMRTSLKRDICHIGTKSKTDLSNLELEDLHKRFIPGHLKYACRHWADHLCFVNIADQDADIFHALEEFASTTLLFWVEALSLMGSMGDMLSILENVCLWYDSQGLPTASIFRELFGDVMSFFTPYIPAIDDCPSQVYTSILPFLDAGVQLRNIYLASSHPNITVLSGVLLGINCVCYSPDGNEVVSGLMDGTINVWNPATATIVETRKAHSCTILALTYSPNGEMLASASSEGTLKIWDTRTRQVKETIDLPAERTTTRRARSRASLTFSPDNNLLAFVSPNSRCIWDTKQWKEKWFSGQGESFVQGGNWVALPPDRTCFAVADSQGIYVVDLNGLRYIVRDQCTHHHLVFSEDSTLLRSSQGTYSVATAEPVDTGVYRERFSKDLYLRGAWLIDKEGNKHCWIPEIHRMNDSYATCKNKIVFCGNDRLTFVEVHPEEVLGDLVCY